MLFGQAEYDLRCEWGLRGLRQLAPISDALIIVDVLSFSTSVSIATGRGGIIFPYARNDASKIDFARSVNAQIAGLRNKSAYSLSPASLLHLPPGTRLVLPSPNGATLSLATGSTATFASCLRNCRAVAAAAASIARRIAVIPAGERWPKDGLLRFALEDLLGAGAILSYLPGRPSPEAQGAVALYRHYADQLPDLVSRCGSGLELRAKGFEEDVALAAQRNADDSAPLLQDGAYVNKA